MVLHSTLRERDYKNFSWLFLGKSKFLFSRVQRARILHYIRLFDKWEMYKYFLVTDSSRKNVTDIWTLNSNLSARANSNFDFPCRYKIYSFCNTTKAEKHLKQNGKWGELAHNVRKDFFFQIPQSVLNSGNAKTFFLFDEVKKERYFIIEPGRLVNIKTKELIQQNHLFNFDTSHSILLKTTILHQSPISADYVNG